MVCVVSETRGRKRNEKRYTSHKKIATYDVHRWSGPSLPNVKVSSKKSQVTRHEQQVTKQIRATSQKSKATQKKKQNSKVAS